MVLSSVQVVAENKSAGRVPASRCPYGDKEIAAQPRTTVERREGTAGL